MGQKLLIIFGDGEKVKKDGEVFKIMDIPFSSTYITENEEKYIKECLYNGRFSGDGVFTKKVTKFMEKKFQCKKILLTTSCSTALDMAAILLDLKEGDEVIMPSFTFVSTANAIVLRGARPVFADIKQDTLNIDPSDIERKITQKTKAIFPVHYSGVSCDMDAIINLASKYNLKVVEDAAQGVNAKYKDKYLGTIGDIGCYSFHETKNYTCGEGGAILLNNDDEKLLSRAEIIREKGTNRSQFFRGEVDKYSWVDVGSSYLLSDILAALLLAQLEKLEEINRKRKKIYDFYYENLKELEKIGLLRLPIIPEECTSNYHIFYILLDSEKRRNYLMDTLKENGILSVFHYVPLHTSQMGKNLGYQYDDLPKTTDISKRLLRLPIYPGLDKRSLEYITTNIFKHIK